MKIGVVLGDITEQDVDAVVTAANEPLRGGGGVDRAVHAAAGPQLLLACRPLAPCPPGSAVITPAFELDPVRWVIHAVGPRFSGAAGDPELLRSAYRSALARADEVGARTVAFPSISTGSYSYPAEEAAQLSIQTLRAAATDVQRVVLVARSPDMAQRWQHALQGPCPRE